MYIKKMSKHVHERQNKPRTAQDLINEAVFLQSYIPRTLEEINVNITLQFIYLFKYTHINLII